MVFPSTDMSCKSATLKEGVGILGKSSSFEVSRGRRQKGYLFYV